MEFSIKQSVLKEELGYIQGVVEQEHHSGSFKYFDRIARRRFDPHRPERTLTSDPLRCRGDDKDAGCDLCSGTAFDLVRTMSDGDVHFKRKRTNGCK